MPASLSRCDRYGVSVGVQLRPGRRAHLLDRPVEPLDPGLGGTDPTLEGDSEGPRLAVRVGRLGADPLELVEGASPVRALLFELADHPRVHLEDSILQCEGGNDPAELARLEEWGYDVRAWQGRNLFFGGVSGVEFRADGTLAAAGDPRRGGDGVVVG